MKIVSLVISFVYFLIGVVCICLCSKRFEPYTLAFIGLIVEGGIWTACCTKIEKTQKLPWIIEWIFAVGMACAIIGGTLFLGIVLITLIIDWEPDLFYQQDLSTLVAMILMLMGAGGLLTKIVYSLVVKSDKSAKKRIWACILAAVCLGFSVWGFVDCSNNKDEGGSAGSGTTNSGTNNSGNTNNSGLSKYLGLSVSVSSLKTSSAYTYVYCEITNVSSVFGTPTQYRYVKVKGVFRDKSGNIVDTDSTYAIDGTWLAPGEKKTFYFMVRNTNLTKSGVTLSIE